jgi:hypothetical protein
VALDDPALRTSMAECVPSHFVIEAAAAAQSFCHCAISTGVSEQKWLEKRMYIVLMTK